ncbi:hypothetical protein EPO14_02300 [Patescibacteria group bacterium]|nr:MAG: hypothetical protein EPO14_02300 [Patescibacteria group bacterium]
MICRLCLKEKQLCKNSHIIPDFMYQELFDEKTHTLVKGLPGKGRKPEIKQSGEKEGELLCADCDNRIIGGYEGYASKVLYGGTSLGVKNVVKADDGLEITIVQGLDYKKFKLFLLSLLWRASISKNHFFSAVDLGPYEEKLRQVLISGNPGSSANFPCVLTSYKRTSIPSKVVVAPIKSRFEDGKIIYSFIISGFMYVFKIIENEKTDWVLEATINEKGEMQVPHTPKESATRLFNAILGQAVF